jgi:hypothetical protein
MAATAISGSQYFKPEESSATGDPSSRGGRKGPTGERAGRAACSTFGVSGYSDQSSVGAFCAVAGATNARLTTTATAAVVRRVT